MIIVLILQRFKFVLPLKSSPCNLGDPPPFVVSLSTSGSHHETGIFLFPWKTLRRGHQEWDSWQRRNQEQPWWQSRTTARFFLGSHEPSRACRSIPREWCTGRLSTWTGQCCQSWWCHTEAPPSRGHTPCPRDTRRNLHMVWARQASLLHRHQSQKMSGF